MTTQRLLKPSAAIRRPVRALSGPTCDERLPGTDMPLVIRRVDPALDAGTWLRDKQQELQTTLSRVGAILFRGFNVDTADGFRHFVEACCPRLMDYRERSSPRTQIAEGVYTSTDHPPDQQIFPHNEHSYSLTIPLTLAFGCLQPAERGGETPLADCRRITAAISEPTKRKFLEKNWMLVRNYNAGFGVAWPTAFQTESKDDVERLCRERDIQFEWRAGDRLRTWQVRPAMIQHPRTGERLWFNHATFFHVSTLEPSTRDGLLASFDECDLPTNTYYGDGSPIEADVLSELRNAYLANLVTFAWQSGDVILVDNLRVAHSRNAFHGPRRVLFAMADPYERADVHVTR